MDIDIGTWDLALIATVSLHATAIAYAHRPKWKALLLSLPVPFTLATLALDVPFEATHVAGLVLLLFFTHGVRWLHLGAGLGIVPSIVLSATGYCLIGSGLSQILSQSEAAFWLSAVPVGALSLALCFLLPHRDEPGHRSPLPLWLKLPIVVAVIVVIVVLKKALRGFMAVFPMVGVVAAYEARHCLWTIGRQIPAIMLGIALMMIVSRLTYRHVGMGISLVFAWIAFLAVFFSMMRVMWAGRPPEDECSGDEG